MRFVGSVAALALVLVSCSTGAGTTSTMGTTPERGSSNDPAVELSAARQRWQETGPDTYWYQLVDDCGECDPSSRLPRRVVIWSGEPTGPNQQTVQSLFAEIETAIEQGRNVEVSYNPDSGHPTDIGFDMQDRVVDGGYHLLVEDLAAGLPGDEVALDRLEQARRVWESQRPDAYEFRTSIHCDCDIAGTIWTRVEQSRIVDWNVELVEEPGTQISPITIDMMFDDLAEMLSLAEGVVEEGVRFTGSAAYHPELGYPTWVGLDIEILDPTSELAQLPPRLVFSIEGFALVEGNTDRSASSELEDARALWEAAGLSDYRYELTLHDIESASFTDPYTITVEHGVVVRVESQGRMVDDIPPTALPVEMILDLIEERIADGDTVDALYNSQLGHPAFAAIRESPEGTSVLAFSIHQLTPLP